jgi:ribosomal-protein-alanine N-acetyltransferase
MNPDKIDYDIKTERLFLRPLQDEDVPKMFAILQKYPDITKFMSFEPPQKEEETRGFFYESQKSFPEKSIRWGIFLEGKFVGIIALEGIERKMRAWITETAEIGYWLSPEFHNQGIMTEAGKAVLGFGFERLKLHKITINHISENIASQKVIEKMGFRYVGEMKDHFFRSKKWMSDKLYEMNVDEFNAQ